MPHCRRCHLIVVIVVGVSDLAPRCLICRCRSLVVIAVSSFPTETSLPVAMSVGFWASSLLSSLLDILFSLASLCCCRRRLLAVGVVVIGCLIVGGVSLYFSSACCRHRHHWRSLVVVVVVGVAEFSEKLVYIRLTMHATTMDPQHQSQNGPAAL